MLMQLHSTIFIIPQRLWRTVQDDTFEQSYTKSTSSIYSSYSWLVINVPVCIENKLYWSL